jgi:hypothetical protein
VSEGVLVSCRLPAEAVAAIERAAYPGGRSGWLRELVLRELGLPDPGDGRRSRKKLRE